MKMNLSLERFFSELFALLSLFALAVDCYDTGVGDNSNYSNNKEWFKIEGKVQAPDAWAKANPDWKLNTQVLIDGGEYRAYLRYVIWIYKLSDFQII